MHPHRDTVYWLPYSISYEHRDLCSEVLLKVRERKGHHQLPAVLHWDNLNANLYIVQKHTHKDGG